MIDEKLSSNAIYYSDHMEICKFSKYFVRTLLEAFEDHAFFDIKFLENILYSYKMLV